MEDIRNASAYAAARKRHILANANKTFYGTFDRADEVEDWLISVEYDNFWSKNEFATSLHSAWAEYGKLTEGQYNAVCNIIDKQAARKAEWDANREADKANKNATLQHVGVLGKRMQFELTVVAVIAFDRPQFHYYDSGIGYITIMEDFAGNKIVYMGRLKEVYDDDDYIFADKGDDVVFMAMVKEHGVRDGAKQTIIQRPTKVKGIA